MPKNIRQYLRSFADFIEIVFIAVAVILLSYVFAGQFLEVSGNSMLPTFADKEQLVAEKVSVKVSPLKRGEIVIFEHPKETNHLVIKRIVGLPNEKITIVDGMVLINGTKLEEPYIQASIQTNPGKELKESVEYFIEPNAYVVLGDNRLESIDSREWGALKKEYIIGRAFVVFSPLDHFRLVKD
jgi:signal peptidase I